MVLLKVIVISHAYAQYLFNSGNVNGLVFATSADWFE